VLDSVHITTNKNMIPYDTQKPFVTSGLRVGTPAVTTRGMREAEMPIIAELIADALRHHQDETVLAQVRARVRELTARFPVHFID
jgi:glycine hydroxymethyltransferase